jgi:hypothetical protein
MGRHEDLPHLEPGHWDKVPGRHSEQTYEFRAYRTEVVSNGCDQQEETDDEAARQMRHAREQQTLAGMYPDRCRPKKIKPWPC